MTAHIGAPPAATAQREEGALHPAAGPRDESVGAETNRPPVTVIEGRGALADTGDPFANKRGVLVIVFLGVFMATLDGSIVNIALPVMATGFRVDPGAVAPVVSVYLVAIAATVLLFGALGDRLGRRPLYLSGFALFTAGSALCATAWALEALVIFRIVQAVGAAMIFSVGPAILTQSFPRSERGAALGWIATAVAAGQTAGPVLGGLLLDSFGWPSIFLLNLPIGAGTFLAASRLLPKHKAEPRRRRSDATHPLHRTKGVVRRNREFVAANASTFLSFITIGAVAFSLPFYLSHVLGFGAYRMGLVMLPTPLAIALIGPPSGRLSDRIGPRIPCAAGLALAALSVVALSMLDRASSDFDIVWRLALFGGGMALFQSPNNSSALGSVRPQLLGLASGMLATMRVLGIAVGVSVGALLLGLFYAAHTGGLPLPPGDVAPDAAAFVAAQRLMFLVVAAICAAGIATSLVRADHGEPSKPQVTETPSAVRGR